MLLMSYSMGFGTGGSGITPVVKATNTSRENTAVETHTINLPASIIAGDLLLAFYVIDGTSVPETPSGWTNFFSTGAQGANIQGVYRDADGGEGDTVDFTSTSNAQESAHVSYRISGAINPATQAPENSTATNGSSTAPDAASLTATGGAKNYLWIAVQGHDGLETTSGFPTNYVSTLSIESTGAGPVGVGAAQRSLNTATEDTGAFTLSGITGWIAHTVVVHPA